MKKLLIVSIIVASVCMLSCTSKKEQMLREQHLKDSFNNLVSSQKGEIETLFAQMKDIDENLNSIATQYTELQNFTNKTGEVDDNTAKNISVKINAMADMIAKDKAKLAALQRNLSTQKNSFAQNKRLQEQMKEMNERLNERENEIASLTQQLKDKNIQLKDLNAQVTSLQNETKKAKAELSESQDKQYTAYFIVGTKKELKKAGVIDSKGGFIGIGKTITLAANSSIENMQKIDIRNVDEIPLVGKRVKMITPHSASSYTFIGGQSKATSLKINSTEEFWRNSRCLVILVK